MVLDPEYLFEKVFVRTVNIILLPSKTVHR